MIYRILLLASVLAAAPVFAQDTAVISDAEKAAAQDSSIDGPTETVGIERVEKLGALALGKDFEGMEGRSLRARRITVAPGAVVAVHQHDARPGVAYILEGELVETRVTGGGERVRKAGDTALEKADVIHWWRNDSGKQAIVLIVDIVPDEQL